MKLSNEQCYAALLARDRRFDGQFFTAVSSTGIYCRPVCTAKTPRKENVSFYPSAVLAQQAGYRPCLRCRPECAPGQARGMDSDVLASRASELIDGGFLDRHDVPDLAHRLNVSERQLRRAIRQELGVTASELASTRRLLTARKLLVEAQLPIVDVALAAGFSSLRNFNAQFKSSYGQNPSSIRRKRGNAAAEKRVSFSLGYRPPYDWDHILNFLALRCIAGIEKVENGQYWRFARYGSASGWICVHHEPENAALRLECAASLLPRLSELIPNLRRVLDLDADPKSIAAHFQNCPELQALNQRYPGQRIPGAWSAFEGAVRAVLGQQVTVVAAIKLTTNLVDAVTGHDAAARAFPLPREISDEAIEQLKMPGSRKKALKALVAWFCQFGDQLETLPPEDLRASLLALHGIGPWTVDYLDLRAFGNPDAFPAGDIVLRKHTRLGENLSAKSLAELAKRWSPWRGYATLLIWRHASEFASNN